MDSTDTFPLAEQADKPAIYSPRAIQAFSVLFSSLAGGILTFYSLRSAGQARAGRQALWVSVGYFGFVVLLTQVMPIKGGISMGLGYVGGIWLVNYLKKYVPDEATYPRKSIVKPLLIWMVIVALVLAVSVSQL